MEEKLYGESSVQKSVQDNEAGPSYIASPTSLLSPPPNYDEAINVSAAIKQQHVVTIPQDNPPPSPPNYNKTTSFRNQSLCVQIVSIVVFPFYFVFFDFIPWLYNSFEKLIITIWDTACNAVNFIGLCIYNYILCPIDNAINWVGRMVYEAICFTGLFIYNYILCPIDNGINWLGKMVYKTICGVYSGFVAVLRGIYLFIIIPIGIAISVTGKFIYNWIIIPIWNGICAVGRGIVSLVVMIKNCIVATVSFIYRRIMVPVWNGICAVVRFFISAVNFLFNCFIRYVVIPIKTAIVFLWTWLVYMPIRYFLLGIKIFLQGIWWLLGWTYSNVIVPTCKFIARSFVTFLRFLLVYVFAPIRKIVGFIITWFIIMPIVTVIHGIKRFFEAAWFSIVWICTNVIAPTLRFFRRCCIATYHFICDAIVFLYTWLIYMPIKYFFIGLAKCWHFFCLGCVAFYRAFINYILIPLQISILFLWKWLIVTPITYFCLGVKRLYQAFVFAVSWIWTNVVIGCFLRPIYLALKFIFNQMFIFAMNVFMACKSLSKAIGRFVWKWILNPIWTGLCWVASGIKLIVMTTVVAIRDVMHATASAIKYVVVTIATAIKDLFVAIGQTFRDFIVIPIRNVIVGTITFIVDGILVPMRNLVRDVMLSMVSFVKETVLAIKMSISGTMKDIRNALREVMGSVSNESPA
ncbi:hypothetical protein BKA69DRAFT_1092041 [Paraphysoderma sedebokerense]|nr:hypothetical protein BKA69DRAFT_1092041 [Paraphysoderma sedebokerense]